MTLISACERCPPTVKRVLRVARYGPRTASSSPTVKRGIGRDGSFLPNSETGDRKGHHSAQRCLSYTRWYTQGVEQSHTHGGIPLIPVIPGFKGSRKPLSFRYSRVIRLSRASQDPFHCWFCTPRGASRDPLHCWVSLPEDLGGGTPPWYMPPPSHPGIYASSSLIYACDQGPL